MGRDEKSQVFVMKIELIPKIDGERAFGNVNVN